MRSDDGGVTFVRKYPPVDASVPYGIEGDLQAFGNDIDFFGTLVVQGVSAHSTDRGETWTVVPIPVAFAANDQSWSYLGPFSGLTPAQTAPYVLAGWFRIGSVALFSFDGGLTWPIQTPLVGDDGSGSMHVVCQQSSHAPTSPGDTRNPNALFKNHKQVTMGVGEPTDGSTGPNLRHRISMSARQIISALPGQELNTRLPQVPVQATSHHIPASTTKAPSTSYMVTNSM